MYQVTRLENGLTVATAAMPHMASVSLGLWAGVGSRYEDVKLNGASHFIEHLLFKGTKRRTAAQISEAVEGIGGYLNAWTSEESTCFYSKALHHRFDELLDVLSDMFLESTFAPVEIGKEREVIKEEIAMYRDQPSQYVQEILNETLWPRQPLGRSIAGTEKSLDRIGRRELLGFFQSHYVASTTLIAAAGNLRHADVVKAVRRIAKKFRPGQKPACTPSDNTQTEPRLRLCTRATEQTQLSLGIRACSRHDERRFALRVLNAALGENMSSRLFQIIREDRGLAYSVYSQPSFFDDTGDLVISAGLDTENVEKTLRLIFKELRAVSAQALPAAELRRARDYVIGQMDMSLENTEPQMMWLGEYFLGYGRVPEPAAIRERLAKVTAAEVKAVAQAFFRTERLNLALVSPMKKAEHLRKSLKV